MNGLFQWLADMFRTVQWWVVVNPWELAVLVRAGKHTHALSAGWHWRIPWVDKIWVFNTRLRFTSWPAQTLSTSDGKTITLAGNIGFRITDPLALMLNIQEPESSYAAIVQATIADYVNSRSFDELDRIELEQECKDDLKRVSDGCEFEFVRVTDFAAMRTYRLVQSNEEYRPSTRPDKEPGEQY